MDGQSLLERLISEHKPGHALQREFQTDPGIYRLDLERIWRRGWLFAGHTCQVKDPGDYFVFDVDTDSLVVIRGDDGRIHALHNTCRHRGMRICQDETGHVGRIVCPYHQWSYARNGELVPRLGPQGFERAKVAAVRNYEVRANWKLVWENNRECWHCAANHPQYVRANWDNAPIDDAGLRREIEAHARA